jgi:hypothetical protein
MLTLADRDRVVVDANVQKICDEMTTAIKLVKDFLKRGRHTPSN